MESAAARVCREAGAMVTTNVMVTCFRRTMLTPDDWRLLRTVCLCSMAHKSLWTPLWSHLSDEMAPHTPSAQEKTVLLCDWPVVGKNVPTLSYQVNMAGPGWSFWFAKWGADGLRDPVILSAAGQGQDSPCPSQSSDSAKLAWMWRWGTILACASAKALAQSLLERRPTPGHDGPTPSVNDVVEYTFNPKSISSTDTFIQTRFHPMTLSIQTRFHPMTLSSKTLSSNFDTFIQ